MISFFCDFFPGFSYTSCVEHTSDFEFAFEGVKGGVGEVFDLVKEGFDGVFYQWCVEVWVCGLFYVDEAKR